MNNLTSNPKSGRRHPPLLTLGIPTYNRPEHILQRISDLNNLGFLNHPGVEIIIHDNDSDQKDHCETIRRLQKESSNLTLIQSCPNLGMVKGVYKILARAKGRWISILGDDDPIIIKCSEFLELIKKNEKCDHLYFQTLEYVSAEVRPLTWFPKIKEGNYTPSEICAKTGLTTFFAHLASHCFKNKPKLAELWLQSHGRSLFYGHCIMFLEKFRRSFYTGSTIAAWRSGNERISRPFHLVISMELRNLLRSPPSQGLKKFLQLNPANIRKEGRTPLKNYLKNSDLESILGHEKETPEKRIVLERVRALNFKPENNIHIDPSRLRRGEEPACVFVRKKTSPTTNYENAAVVFRCGPEAKIEDMCQIVKDMRLTGRIFVNGVPISPLMLLAKHCQATRGIGTWKIRAYAIVMFSLLMYGPEKFHLSKIILNYFERPQQNLYRLVRALERKCRLTLRRAFSRGAQRRAYVSAA